MYVLQPGDVLGATISPAAALTSLQTQLTTSGSPLLALIPSVDTTFIPPSLTACSDGSYQVTCPTPAPEKTVSLATVVSIVSIVSVLLIAGSIAAVLYYCKNPNRSVNCCDGWYVYDVCVYVCVLCVRVTVWLSIVMEMVFCFSIHFPGV